MLSLLALGAISGISFIFSRIAVEQFSPLLIATVRTILGGGIVLIYGRIVGESVLWHGNIRLLLIVGILNFSAPFILYSYSATVIPAAYSAILNALAPIISFILATLILNEQYEVKKIFGLGIGIVGVAALCLDDLSNKGSVLGVVACLAGAGCYAAGGVFAKARAVKLNVISIAGAAQLLSGLLLLPVAGAHMPTTALRLMPTLSLLALVVINSAIAYVMYFRILVNYGPTKALTITFLAPAFAGFWGYIILNEGLNSNFWIGAISIAISVSLITGLFDGVVERIKNVNRAL